MNFKIIIFTVLLFPLHVFAMGTYMEPKEFLAKTFFGNTPSPEKLWITEEITRDINEIMGHDLGVVRLRYWDNKQKRAWILEEIGRDKPITVGLVTADNAIQDVKVLVFRESRGWEIKYPFFTDQFNQVQLNNEKELNKHIDGISGATLSVNALRKLARLALYFESVVSSR